MICYLSSNKNLENVSAKNNIGAIWVSRKWSLNFCWKKIEITIESLQFGNMPVFPANCSCGWHWSGLSPEHALSKDGVPFAIIYCWCLVFSSLHIGWFMLHTLGVAPQLCLVSRTFRRRSPQITSLATVLGKGLHEEEITFEMVSTLKMEMHLYHIFHTHIHQFQFRISPLCWYESGWPKWELHFVQAHTKNHIQKRNFQSWHRFVLSRNS